MKDKLIQWLKDWFDINGKNCKAVLGLSGGKDSNIVAALCVEALGKERVLGVLMPNGIQIDINDAHDLANYLDIETVEINIRESVNSIMHQIEDEEIGITKQAKENLPPRIRMSTLYAVSQSVNGRVIETSNLSERIVSWETRWGDAVGDVAPIADLTVEEVKLLGRELELPDRFINKVPSDGLCGRTDEEALGVTYQEIDDYIRKNIATNEVKNIVDTKYNNSKFKREDIPEFKSGFINFVEINNK